jgi:hypothetical protein
MILFGLRSALRGFTTLPPAEGLQESQHAIRKELMHAVHAWVRKIESTKSEVKRNSIRVLKLILRELLASFSSRAVLELGRNVNTRVVDLGAGFSEQSDQAESQSSQRSIDCPVEYSEINKPPQSHD